MALKEKNYINCRISQNTKDAVDIQCGEYTKKTEANDMVKEYNTQQNEQAS